MLCIRPNFAGGELMSDYAIRLNAVSDDRIIITKDSDFLENYLVQGAPPRILLIQLGNIRNRDLMDFFDLNWSSIIQQFESGAGLIILERASLTIY